MRTSSRPSRNDVDARKMVDVRPTVDLAPLAPRRLQGEAISSWLVRTSEAHRLMLSELEEELGCSVAAFDRGNFTHLSRLALMTGVAAAELAAATSQDLIAHPLRVGPGPRLCWAICPDCLTDDVKQGRPAHVRSTWVHPLTTACPVHRRHLVPYAASSVRTAVDELLFNLDEGPERRDILLETADFDDWRMLERVNRTLQRAWYRDGATDLLRLRYAVGDVVDALATRVRPPLAGALMNVFEEPMFGRRSGGGSLSLPENCWSDLEAADRLLFVRVALAILAEPPDPADGQPRVLGRDWLLARYNHSRVSGWQSAFEHAVLDPLFVLTTELPRAAVVQISERSVAWPAEIRRRWTYATAAGALGGYVF